MVQQNPAAFFPPIQRNRRHILVYFTLKVFGLIYLAPLSVIGMNQIELQLVVRNLSALNKDIDFESYGSILASFQITLTCMISLRLCLETSTKYWQMSLSSLARDANKVNSVKG